MKKRITIYIDESDWVKFRAQCIGLNISASARIQEFIESQLNDAWDGGVADAWECRFKPGEYE